MVASEKKYTVERKYGEWTGGEKTVQKKWYASHFVLTLQLVSGALRSLANHAAISDLEKAC